ncbi:RNA binding S1 domain-containing protein [Fictibacillus macauensis ZFHKF-1]|uniref:RNA binding S1 domain-containing protein n=1 Tax=Fictibacillus macauensis ZFHKF-1 TaxID=1196324 RepID=I8ALM4_9BACL|nr:S1-like domain-containing RNA-binding protein [Fictibacillus macauensis]EIT86822.1 RNA binding S1 domain-containing protein [Fictibacillus macauensis ZFHKF-1]
MDTTIRAGEMYTLKVDRQSDFGYFLSDGTEEVMLHKREASRSLQDGDEVTVFVYQDHEGRLAATMSEPKVRLDSLAWLTVVGSQKRLGVFLDIGIAKDVLLSNDDLPGPLEEWPRIGDQLYAGLRLDKKGRLFADLASEEELVEIAESAEEAHFNKQVTGHVYKLNEVGALLYTKDHHIGFIHRDEMTRPLRLGEEVEARISFVREDGRVNLSMKPRKEQAYSEDAEMIYAYLKEHKGQMPYTDRSEPEAIKTEFNISKAAFKRALGKLMKENKIKQEEGVTFLKI